VTHAYPSFARSPALSDAGIAVAFVAIACFVDAGPLRTVLLGAIVLVLAWGIATLHYPSRVEIDAEGVAFHRYGRAHRFAWSDVKRVRVRRFVVRDRVLVRIEPSTAWRGRYWVDERIEGFEGLVKGLEGPG